MYLIFQILFLKVIPLIFWKYSNVIVLRCHPDELKERLIIRKYKIEKLIENMEAEALKHNLF